MVTDVTPTILSIAGIDQPTEAPVGPMDGKDLYPLIHGEIDSVYHADETIGMEAAGQCVLYKGDVKLVRNGRPYGDGVWRMYNLANDPGETIDLSKSSPKLFAEMIRHYSDYTDKYGVLEMGISYEPLQEIHNKLKAQLMVAAMPWLIGFGVLMLGIFVWRRNRRKLVVGD